MVPDINEKRIEAYIHAATRTMYDFAEDTFSISVAQRPAIRIDFAKRRKITKSGGRDVGITRGNTGKNVMVPFISYACSPIIEMAKEKNLTLIEYRRYTNDAEIGSYSTNDWRVYLNGVIAHQIANISQEFITEPHIIAKLQGPGKGHGQYWRNIYKVLRKEFVNNMTPIIHNIDDAITIIDQTDTTYSFRII